MAIGGLIAFISFYAGLVFIFGFFLVGYYVGVIRNVIKGEEHPLPDWSNMSKLFVDGILGAIIIFGYLVVIGGLCALVIVQFATDPFIAEFEMVMGIITTSILTLLALGIFINFGLMQFAITENFASAFSLADFFHFIKGKLGNYIGIIIFSFILNGILFFAGLGIISPFTNFWGMVVQAHLFGQCAKESHSTTTAIQSA